MATKIKSFERHIRAGHKYFAVLTLFACAVALVGCFWLVGESILLGQSTTGGSKRAAPAVSTIPTSPGAPTAEEIKILRDEAQKLRDETEKIREESSKLQSALDSERREAEAFRWLLTVIIGLGAIYSLFQGLFSYLNVQELKSQAKTAIDGVEGLRTSTATGLEDFRKTIRTESEEDFAQFRKECERAFPLFTGFEKTLGTMALTMKSRLKPPSLNKANVYRSLREQGDLALEEVYYYEKSAASLQFVEASSPSDMFIILRGLCRFYLDKHRAEREDHAQNPQMPAPDPSDIVRAKYYLHRADRLPGGKDFRISNEYGYIAMFSEFPPDRDRAKICFSESKLIQPAQQCAYYNLARIAHAKALAALPSDPTEAGRLIMEAIAELRLAVPQPNWEDSPEIEKGSSVSYNLACAFSRWAELAANQQEKQDRLAESYKALERSVNQAPYARSSFEQDCKPGEDLAALNADSAYTASMADLAKKIKDALQLRTI